MLPSSVCCSSQVFRSIPQQEREELIIIKLGLTLTDLDLRSGLWPPEDAVPGQSFHASGTFCDLNELTVNTVFT